MFHLERVHDLIRGRDLVLNSAQNPHALEYIPVFPRCLAPTDALSLQIVNRFLRMRRVNRQCHVIPKAPAARFNGRRDVML